MGGVNYGYGTTSTTDTSTGLTATTKGGLGYGGGLLAEPMSFPLEVGVLYLSRHYQVTRTGFADSSTNLHFVEIPVMFRLGHGSMTFGLGGFADIDIGDGSNYGLTAGPRFGGTHGGGFLDLRFSYGLKAGHTEDIAAMLGYAF